MSSHLASRIQCSPAGLADILVSWVGLCSFPCSGRGLKQRLSENSREEACNQGQQEQGQQGNLVHLGSWGWREGGRDDR